MAQLFKDLVLSLLWLRFDTWPRELPHAMDAAKKRKNGRKEGRVRGLRYTAVECSLYVSVRKQSKVHTSVYNMLFFM